MPKTVIVVPCYNEARRMREAEFLPLLQRPELEILFVDDGSGDGTHSLLESIAERAGPSVQVLALAQNNGKGEAVRHGLRHALERGASIVGFMDADASTPASEMLRLLEALEESGADVVLGARIRLLGNTVHRQPLRHYLGRVFASVASLALDLPVYDTQCGAKLFRDNGALRAALAQPFSSRWVFDVELLGRLLTGYAGSTPVPSDRFLELPLGTWRDVAGSKLGIAHMIGSGLALLRIGADLRGARRRAQHERKGATDDQGRRATT